MLSASKEGGGGVAKNHMSEGKPGELGNEKEGKRQRVNRFIDRWTDVFNYLCVLIDTI